MMAQQVKEPPVLSLTPGRRPADNSRPPAPTSPLTQDPAHSIDSLNTSKINL